MSCTVYEIAIFWNKIRGSPAWESLVKFVKHENRFHAIHVSKSVNLSACLRFVLSFSYTDYNACPSESMFTYIHRAMTITFIFTHVCWYALRDSFCPLIIRSTIDSFYLPCDLGLFILWICPIEVVLILSCAEEFSYRKNIILKKLRFREDKYFLKLCYLNY